MMKEDPIASALESHTAETELLTQKLFEAERKLLTHGDLEQRLKVEKDTNAALEKEIRLLTKFAERKGPPGWLKKQPRSKKKYHGTPWFFLSDLHLDEVVKPEEVLNINAYNRDIAKMRLETLCNNFVAVTQDHWAGVIYDGIVLPLGGDLFSGDIHEELKETNEDTILGSIEYWVGHLGDVIQNLHEVFGKIHVPVVVGNHGRTTRKPRAKMRARSNFDWFMGVQLARMFANNPNITFDISDSADCRIPSYDRHVMLTHGDQVTGGQGIGGIWPPIMRLDARKRQRQETIGEGYDILILGHWHTLTFGPSFIVNGSMKGYDEYAFTMNFSNEQPMQAAWLMTPEHGKTWTAPIFCQNREAEGW